MIRIVTDSVASIPAKLAEAQGINVISLFINWNGREYEDATMDIDAFYTDIYDMVDDIPTSSQPSQAELEAYFEDAAKDGDEVLGVFMSSKMSGTVEGALLAARKVAERYEKFSYKIVDSLSNSFDEAWSVIEAARARSAGKTLDECCEVAREAIASTRFLFAPESLRFLKAGGRIGNGTALLGSIMKICPIFTVTDGETNTFGKVRTQKKALSQIAKKLESDSKEFGLKEIIVHYIGSSDTAVAWARDVIEPICGRAVEVVPVSPVIGLHVGPAVGIAYECASSLPGKLSPGVDAPVHSY